jgi:hypothetical protein
VNANASVRYESKPVVATVGAGFAYDRSDSSVEKAAQNFSREVVAKAVSRVQTRTSEQRSVTKLFETEETNTHKLEGDSEHVSGFYRWLDKRYKAQLYNYGKRMMFEFVLPEPAAFFVTSRLRAHEARLTLPKKPADPVYVTPDMPVDGPAAITREKFDELRTVYDLSAFSYPALTKTVSFVDTTTGASLHEQSGIDGSDRWVSKTLKCSFPGATGYELRKLMVTGNIQFDDHHNPPSTPEDRNIAWLEIDGTKVWDHREENIYVALGDRTEHLPAAPYLFTDDDVDVVLSLQDAELYRVMLAAELGLGAQALLDWQTKVYNVTRDVEQKKADARNREIKLRYDTEMSTYANRLAELEATALDELLRGTSESANAEIIATELRRQCLAMITKELSSDAAMDMLTRWDATAMREVDHHVTRFELHDKSKSMAGAWTTTQVKTDYPVPDVGVARRKGRHVQFLEQAFDWDNLAYVFYPYFWAVPQRWIELTSRADVTDPNLTAFLRAGAVRVLVAVTPAYDDAVLHFLATREPWEGGPSPVIGDPLYLPLHEELRQQYDDLYGATPDGEPWEFTLPTTLVYLHDSGTPIPDLPAERQAREERVAQRAMPPATVQP